MTVAAVLFDFDGTLVESLDVKINAFRELYAVFGEGIAEQAVAHYRANTGMPRNQRIAHCHNHLLGRETTDREVALLSEQFGGMVEDKVVASPWVPGAKEFLDAHDGTYPLFIVSATPHAELERIVAARGMEGYFEGVYGSPPDKTAIIHDLISMYWFEPATVVMIGDGRADSEAAVVNETRFIGRQAPGQDAPFPPGTPVLPNLTDLSRYLGD